MTASSKTFKTNFDNVEIETDKKLKSDLDLFKVGMNLLSRDFAPSEFLDEFEIRSVKEKKEAPRDENISGYEQRLLDFQNKLLKMKVGMALVEKFCPKNRDESGLLFIFRNSCFHKEREILEMQKILELEKAREQERVRGIHKEIAADKLRIGKKSQKKRKFKRKLKAATPENAQTTALPSIVAAAPVTADSKEDKKDNKNIVTKSAAATLSLPKAKIPGKSRFFKPSKTIASNQTSNAPGAAQPASNFLPNIGKRTNSKQ